MIMMIMHKMMKQSVYKNIDWGRKVSVSIQAIYFYSAIS